MKDSAGEAARWVRQAEHDLEFGRLAVREGYFGQACFIAQQAAEKAVKAIHYHGGERVVLGHSVVQLADGLRAAVPEIAELMEAAGTLDQYYVPTRYPNALPGGVPFEAFGESQARAAVEDAARFIGLAVQRIRG
jgi:HEPN domain-containing protein